MVDGYISQELICRYLLSTPPAASSLSTQKSIASYTIRPCNHTVSYLHPIGTRNLCQNPPCVTLDAVLSAALLNTANAVIPQVLSAVWPVFPSHSTADASPWLGVRVRRDTYLFNTCIL